MNDMRVWQIVAVGFFLLWALTFSFGYFKSQMIETQWIALFKQELIQAVQQLAQHQRALEQRILAIEKARDSH